MARNVTLAVNVEIVDVADTGYWCTHCNLSTVVRTCCMVMILGESSLLADIRCHECGGRDFEVA